MRQHIHSRISPDKKSVVSLTKEYRTAVFVGDHPLLVACAGRVLDAGMDIVGVCTQDESISDWAAGQGIVRVDWGDLGEHLTQLRPDVFLSVGNLRILPDEMVASAGVTINFHDGPLPKFAGLHTPMWALLEGETDYAVTWHIVQDGIDEGDVLATQSFEISPDETTRSMNMKCMGAAGGAFDSVLSQLTSGQLKPVPQQGTGQYFGRYDRPLPGGALIPHSMTATQIDRYVRALDFGPTLNRVGRPLLQVDGQRLMVVRSASAAETQSGAVPGMVLSAGDTGDTTTITVATTTDDLHLVGWVEAGTDLGAMVGELLPDPTSAVTDIEKVHASASRSEVWWSKRLTEQASVELAQFSGSKEPWASASVNSVKRDFESATAVAAAFVLAYSGATSATVGVGTSSAGEPALEPWFNTIVPVTVSAAQGQSFGDVLASVQADIATAIVHGPYLRDLPLRLPTQIESPVATAPQQVELLPHGVSGTAPLQISLGPAGVGYVVRTRGSANAERVAAGLAAFVGAASDGSAAFHTLPVLGERELAELTHNNGQVSVATFRGALHEQFLAAAAQWPNDVAVVHRGQEITYADLEQRARRVAAELETRGVEPGAFVGVSTAPSLEMLVAVLGVLMSGCAYVPLDPRFPADRLAFMVEDADMALVLTDGSVRLAPSLPSLDIAAISTDLDSAPRDALPAIDHSTLAYMMYTSGSTGSPKGVMVSHGNVDSFLAAMEPHLGVEDGVWLSVTTLSFDISVLELLYPLTHGWKVVLYEGLAANKATTPDPRLETRLDISLFFFGSEGIEGGGSYQVLLDAARYADTHGFAAVWTPERHFNAFGGPFPNPSVTGAAIAAITENVAVRSGSCVLPLHHPARVAEEWAVVDQLSGGRVGLSVAAGWHSDDFIFRPENYGQSKATLIEQIDQLRALWRGEAVTYPGPKGDVDVTTLPRPVQAELPIWYTTAGNVESFELAGKQGFNLLTHLLGQSVEDLSDKVVAYRRARTEAGHAGPGTVSLMLHTFVAADGDSVRETVRGPMKSYLRDSIMLVKDHASEFPTFDPTKTESDGALMGLTPEDLDALLDISFGRYFESSGMFGSVPDAVAFAEALVEIDVDEVAALVDFGVDGGEVLANLTHLNEVRESFLIAPESAVVPETYGSLMAEHGVTHLQCTPSEARLVLAEPASKAALGSLSHMLVGGEPCPVAVADKLRSAVGGQLLNVYGPTETTIWSTVHAITEADTKAGPIPIGKPLGNTTVRVVDSTGRLCPVGAVGELLVGGTGVTAGYHARSELSAERFVDRADTEGTVYRTGDLVSWTDDAVLVFHGRTDSQVKVRGHRIELGEIEAALETRADVAEAVVVVHGEGDEAALVAHIVAADEPPSLTNLQAALAVSLPAHMVPQRAVFADSLPTTPNGKVDRLALTTVETSNDQPDPPPGPAELKATPVEGGGFEATELTQLIEAAWKDVLGLAKIDRFKSFFDHGGNSLQVVTLRDRLELALDRPVSLVDLFRYGSVHELVEAFAVSEATDAPPETNAAPAVTSPAAGDRVSRRAAARRSARRTH